MKRNHLIFYLITLLILLLIGQSPVWADDGALILEISITNPSYEDTEEIDVLLNLPPGLTKKDILSTDGLYVQYNEETDTYVLDGKVVLQPAETTFYKIKVKDIWIIPKEKILKLRSEISSFLIENNEFYVQRQLGGAVSELDLILDIQTEAMKDTTQHIAVYKDNKEKYDSIFAKFQVLKKAADNTKFETKRNRRKTISLIVFIVVFIVVGIFLIRNRKNLRLKIQESLLGGYLKLAKLFPPSQTTCKLLINQESTQPAESVHPFPVVNSLSEGRICLLLEDSYNTQTVVEIDLKLNGEKSESVVFRGSIIWQKQILDEEDEKFYVTGMTIDEVDSDNLRKLKLFVDRNINSS